MTASDYSWLFRLLLELINIKQSNKNSALGWYFLSDFKWIHIPPNAIMMKIKKSITVFIVTYNGFIITRIRISESYN
jgi:hypothetical protein